MGITLKAARINVNLRQDVAAKRLGISVETLRNYESGKSSPTVCTVKKMENLYGVEYKDLIFLPSTTV